MYDELTEELKKELWEEWNESLTPLFNAGKLGVILFQVTCNDVHSVLAADFNFAVSTQLRSFKT